jgi:hypothetical protein
MFALLPFDHPFRESEFSQPFGKSDFVARVFDLAGHGINPGRVLYVPGTVMLTFFCFFSDRFPSFFLLWFPEGPARQGMWNTTSFFRRP